MEVMRVVLKKFSEHLNTNVGTQHWIVENHRQMTLIQMTLIQMTLIKLIQMTLIQMTLILIIFIKLKILMPQGTKKQNGTCDI